MHSLSSLPADYALLAIPYTQQAVVFAFAIEIVKSFLGKFLRYIIDYLFRTRSPLYLYTRKGTIILVRTSREKFLVGYPNMCRSFNEVKNIRLVVNTRKLFFRLSILNCGIVLKIAVRVGRRYSFAKLVKLFGIEKRN